MAKKIKIRSEKPDASIADRPDGAEPVEGELLDGDTQKKQEAEEALAAAAAQDEFQVKGFELVEWIHDHQPVVLAAIGAVLLGGVIFGVYGVVHHSSNESASVAYGKALTTWQAQVGDAPPGEAPPVGEDAPHFKDATARSTAARDLFRGLVKEHSGTGAAELAQLYVGHASLKLADYDEAAKAYQAYLDDVSKTDALRFAGLEGLATALDAKGDQKGAIARLEELVELKNGVDKDGALLELGRLYKATGDEAKAKAVLARIPSEFAESPLKARAEEMIASLGGTPAAAGAPNATAAPTKAAAPAASAMP